MMRKARLAATIFGAVMMMSAVPAMAATTETEPNNTRADANVITAGKTVVGSLSEYEDDVYKFVMPANGNVTFTLAADASVTSDQIATGWNMEIWDEDGNVLQSVDTKAKTITPKMGFSKGTVLYARVYCSQGYWSSQYIPIDALYDVTANVTATSDWETEVNDDISAADKISLDKTYYGTLYSSEDVDIYKVKASAGTLDISLRSNDSNASDIVNGGWKVTILDPDHNELASAGDIKTKESVTATIPATGYYYIKVENSNPWSSAYMPINAIYDLKAINIKTVASKSVKSSKVKKSGFTVKWTKVAGANGYQIRYSTSKNMKNAKTVTIKSATTVSKKITGLKAKKKYYVQIRAYGGKNLKGKTVVGAWSSKKTITTK